MFRAAQRNSWIAYVSSITKDTPIGKIWKKVHKILGKSIQAHIPTLLIDNKDYDPKDVASPFAENLSCISKGSTTESFLLKKKYKRDKSY